MRVALVHDWLTGTRGGEKVLLELVRLFPGAPVFTLFHFPGSVPGEIESRVIHTTFLQDIATRTSNYRKLLPLFFAGAWNWDLSGFDLVISSSHCVAKNARKPPGALHICYCHTPVRYIHDQFDAYFLERPAWIKALARLARRPLSAIDIRAARGVDVFAANSENVRQRIERLYGREADVVYPPVDTSFYSPPEEPSERAGFLIVSALVPYKRLEDAVRASNSGGFTLTIAGFGPEEGRLRKIAGRQVTFAGTPSDEELRRLYRSARAVLMPGEEDFGIVPVEAQACGTPVIALGRGGALETVRDGETGILYSEPGPEALLRGIDRFEKLSWSPSEMTKHAQIFRPSEFREGMGRVIARALEGVKKRGVSRPERGHDA